MIRNRVPANANAVLRRQLKKGVRAGTVVNRTQTILQSQRTATTGTVQTEKKVNALEGMGLPILTKSQSGSLGSKISSLSGDAFQKASSSPHRNYGPIADLSFQNLADHTGEVPNQGKHSRNSGSVIHGDSVNSTDRGFNSSNSLNSDDKFMQKEHPSLRLSTLDSVSIVEGDTVNSTDHSFNSNASLNSDDKFMLQHDPVLKKIARKRTGSVVAGDSVDSTDWGFNSSKSMTSKSSRIRAGASRRSGRAKSQISKSVTTDNGSTRDFLDSTSFDSAKPTQKFHPSELGHGFFPNTLQTSGSNRLADLKKEEDITDYERAKEKALRKTELELEAKFSRFNTLKTIGNFRKQPNVSFDPGQAVPEASQFTSRGLTARYLRSNKPDEEGLKQHGFATEPESYRTHIADSYRAHFPGKLDRIIGWAPTASQLTLDQIAHSQRYTAQNSRLVE